MTTPTPPVHPSLIAVPAPPPVHPFIRPTAGFLDRLTNWSRPGDVNVSHAGSAQPAQAAASAAPQGAQGGQGGQGTQSVQHAQV